MSDSGHWMGDKAEPGQLIPVGGSKDCGIYPFGEGYLKVTPNAFNNKPDAKVGLGGAPTRATTLPSGAEERKKYPIASGVLDYFPDAIAALAHLSWRGNQQHNPDQPLHWDRSKSKDEADTLSRHFLQRGTVDTDGIRHSTKVAWRALALLQKEIEAEQAHR